MPRSVRFHEFGGPDVLKIEDAVVPDPGSQEVRLHKGHRPESKRSPDAVRQIRDQAYPTRATRPGGGGSD